MSRQRERATGNHAAERGDMLRILVVETDVVTTKKAPSGRSVHDVTLDCARIDRHPDETPMDVLLERISFAFDQRHMNPAKQIMRPWRHKRGAGAGGAITARRLDSAEESATMAPAPWRDHDGRPPILQWSHHTDVVVLPDGHVTTGKAFFAAAIDRRPLEIGSTGGSGENDAATHSRDTAGNSEKNAKSREYSFCLGLWAAALQDPLSPLGPTKHANRLIFNALRTLRSNGGEAAGQGALSAAMRDIRIDGLVVSDRGWLPRRILAGPDMEKALADADAAWVAFGQAFHRVTRGACAHTAWLAYEALLADGRPNPDPPDPTWPMPSAHQTMAAALLFDQIKALVVSHSDHLDVSLGLKAQAWRKSGAGKSQEPDHAARPEGGQ